MHGTEIRRQMYVNGENLAPKRGRYFDKINPSNGVLCAQFADGDAQDVDVAVDAARAAKKHWSLTSPALRSNLLWAWADLLISHRNELAILETREVGKPIRDTLNIDVPATVECIKYFARQTEHGYGRVIDTGTGKQVLTQREPVGIVGAITPWNFPLLLSTWKIAAALSCGNVVVLKPSELAASSCLRLAELATEAGIPSGVINVVTGVGATVGAALVRHPGIGKISFTGSTATGRSIIKNSAETIKPLSLELGGKGVQIVFDDADIPAAAASVVKGFTYNQGQLCFAGSRVVIQRSVRDAFLGCLQTELTKLKMGSTEDMATTLGPLISLEHCVQVKQNVSRALGEGAKPLAFGPSIPPALDNGFHFTPIVLETNKGTLLNYEEVFGPVLSLISFIDEEDALDLANSTQFGLSASIWTMDGNRAKRLVRQLRVGTVWVNCFGLIHPAVPFGGLGDSGFGKDLGEEAIHEFTIVKSIWQ